MRADLELQVDLAAAPAVRSPAFGTAVLGSCAALSATAIENHLDVPVVPEPIDQVLVEPAIVA